MGAAFCTYSGFCEHAHREQLHAEWHRIFDSTKNGPKVLGLVYRIVRLNLIR